MPALNPDESKTRFASARVARLATAGPGGEPHLVAIVFAASGDRIVHGVDHKPKSSLALKRLANIAANPRVSVLVDHYSDRWEDLWWVRADGLARVLEDEGERAAAIGRLAEKYPQYRELPPAGPVIEVEVSRWSSWSYSEPQEGGLGPC